MLRLNSGHVVSAVPATMLSEAWPLVLKWLKEALEWHWGFSPGDVLEKLINGEALLWIAEKDGVMLSAAVTEVLIYPRCKTMNIWLLGGSGFAEWKEALVAFEMYARSNGCDLIEATGRPGLGRLLKELGFNVPRVVVAKKIDSVSH